MRVFDAAFVTFELVKSFDIKVLLGLDLFCGDHGDNSDECVYVTKETLLYKYDA